MTTVLTVEEISKVDPSVSALVDIHNTLVNSIIIKLGSAEQKQKYLPRLASSVVRMIKNQKDYCILCPRVIIILGWEFCYNRNDFRFRCFCNENHCKEGWVWLYHQWIKNVDFQLWYRWTLHFICECKSVCSKLCKNDAFYFIVTERQQKFFPKSSPSRNIYVIPWIEIPKKLNRQNK